MRRVTLEDLNALVAEHVMGWRHIEQLKDEGADDDESHVSSIKAGGTTPWKAVGDGNWIRWQPSTDWRHTGEAIEKAPYSVRIDIAASGRTEVIVHDGPIAAGSSWAKTKEVAVCLALLRAYGVEVELETEVEDAG